jgi:hypothetical protein
MKAPQGAILSGFRWSEKPRAGQLRDQGVDVYRHVVAHAGGAQDSLLALVSAYELGKDLWQLATGHRGAKAEVLGSIAGQATGVIMRFGSVRLTRRLVKTMLCK